MQVDPVGYQDGLNLYAYVGNEPINSRDPSGNDKIVCRIDHGQAMGCDYTADDSEFTTVTFANTFPVSIFGNESDETNEWQVKFESISQQGLGGRIFSNNKSEIFEFIEGQLSSLVGEDITLVEDEYRPATNIGSRKVPAWKRRLGNDLVNRASELGRNVARDRGANAQNINEMGHWADKTLKEIAKAAGEDAGAAKALKIIKEAKRLAQKI
jgi:hypothetical protein